MQFYLDAILTATALSGKRTNFYSHPALATQCVSFATKLLYQVARIYPLEKKLISKTEI